MLEDSLGVQQLLLNIVSLLVPHSSMLIEKEGLYYGATICV